MAGLSLAGCDNLFGGSTSKSPAAIDYNIDNLTQTFGSVSAVIITAKEDMSEGAVTIYYEGTGETVYEKSAVFPTAAGTYTVAFNVGAASGWNAANGLSAGMLTINATDPDNETPTAADYDISGIGTFTYDGNPKTVTISGGTVANTSTTTGCAIYVSGAASNGLLATITGGTVTKAGTGNSSTSCAAYGNTTVLTISGATITGGRQS